MQIMNLRIDDSFYPHFKAIIESFVKDKKIEVMDYKSYEYETIFSQNLLVSSVKDVQKRVFEAEKRVYNGEFLTQESYEEEMNRFFKEELGFDR
ncbi:MAG: hypothetical protein KN64_03660 [Sulfurovum sp. AS07-7]|nr:MAG: hypothetical protein KN64_03660 [Sulfurovum sp. AS07-7]